MRVWHATMPRLAAMLAGIGCLAWLLSYGAGVAKRAGRGLDAGDLLYLLGFGWPFVGAACLAGYFVGRLIERIAKRIRDARS